MYVVLEIQAGETISTIVNSYTDRLQAEQAYHQILMAAAVSNIPKHSAIIMDDEGMRINSQVYVHEVE